MVYSRSPKDNNVGLAGHIMKREQHKLWTFMHVCLLWHLPDDTGTLFSFCLRGICAVETWNEHFISESIIFVLGIVFELFQKISITQKETAHCWPLDIQMHAAMNLLIYSIFLGLVIENPLTSKSIRIIFCILFANSYRIDLYYWYIWYVILHRTLSEWRLVIAINIAETRAHASEGVNWWQLNKSNSNRSNSTSTQQRHTKLNGINI